MEPTHILTDDTLRYIAEEVVTSDVVTRHGDVTRLIAYNAALAGMRRVREHYEKVFFWNEARLFKRIAELELNLAKGAGEGERATLHKLVRELETQIALYKQMLELHGIVVGRVEGKS